MTTATETAGLTGAFTKNMGLKISFSYIEEGLVPSYVRHWQTNLTVGLQVKFP